MLYGMRRSLTVLVAGLVLASGACAPGAAPAGSTFKVEAKPTAQAPADIPVRIWKMSVVTNEDSSWTKGARWFSDLVRQRTGGKIVISVYPNGELAGGDQVKELTMLQNGSINFTYHSNLLYSNLDQSFAAISLPWLFTDYAQVDAALAGPAGDQLLEAAGARGIAGLAFGENGFRQLTNSKLAVRRPDDLRGLRVRIPGVKLYSSIYETLGAAPVAMNFGQVAAALRQGEIDGQENPIDIIVSSRLYEVQKHITMWNYSYDALILGISKEDWEGLPSTAQEIIKQAAVEASREQTGLSREAARTQVSLLLTQGMTVTELSPDETNAFRARVSPVYGEWSPRIGESLIQQFRRR